jgi:hypothetical protein
MHKKCTGLWEATSFQSSAQKVIMFVCHAGRALLNLCTAHLLRIS